MDSRVQRETKAYQDRGGSQENQEASVQMVPGEILEILDQEETQDFLDPRETKEDRDSAILDQEDPLETEAIQAGEDPGAAEVTVAPKEGPETKDNQESSGIQVSQVSQEREAPKETLELMGGQGQWVIPGSLTVTS